MNCDVLIPESRSRPIILIYDLTIYDVRFSHAAGHGDIRTLIRIDRDLFAVKDACRCRLRGRFPFSLHESRIAGKGDRFIGIAFIQMDLQEPQGCAAILEIERERFSFLMIAQLLQRVVEHDHIVRHIRRDPHKRISMDSLQ